MKTITKLAIISFLGACLFAAAAHAAAPRPPSDLKLQVKGQGILLTWKASPDDPGQVTGYEVTRATIASGPFRPVGFVSKGMTIFYDMTAKPENIYFYKIRSVAGDQFSDYTRPVTGEIPGM
ncbi:MAG: fibronectin type III domain-containing protein [Syntrophaceae bacterium]